jgi:aspartate/methionine/tyrosine aminotransferase
MAWAKHRAPAKFDLAASNLLGCSIDDLRGAREALSLDGANPDGYPPLAQAIAAHYRVEPERVTVASGCSGANLLAIGASIGPGDDVVMESPFYDPITGTCQFAGGTVHFFARRFEDGYRIDPDAVRRAMTPRTRLVAITNPHNPSGVVLDDADIRAVAAVAAEHGASLLVDEVYLDIVNILGQGPRHTPAALLAENAISTSSLTKSYGLNALRCGWAIGSADATSRMRRVRDVIDGIGPVPIERLSTVAFEQLDRFADRARGLVTANLSAFRLWTAGLPELVLPGPTRATVAFPRVTGVSDTRALAEALQREHDVAVVPGHFFGEPENIRISLAGNPDVLREGLARLARFLRG